SEGALATALSQTLERRAVDGISQKPRARSLRLLIAHAIENADCSTCIGNSEQIADSGEQACAKLARGTGHAQQRHYVLRLAGQEFVHDRSRRNSGTPCKYLHDKGDFSLLRCGENQIVGQPTPF